MRSMILGSLLALGLAFSFGAARAAPDQGEFTIRPPFTPAPELTTRPGVPMGAVRTLTMKSADSKFYSGISKEKPGELVPYVRVVNVYIPAGMKPGQPMPFMVVQDGDSPKYREVLPTILDNLIAQKKIPPMVAVMVNHGGGDGWGSERGLEYDSVSDRYARFIEAEVLPRVAKEYGITFTKDPEARATMGGSSGAAAAFTMAWFHPELYRRVLSYSGTFVNQEHASDPENGHGAWGYHETLIPNSPKKPIRIWLHVSERDNRNTADEASMKNWVIANRHMAAALKAKGYDYRFVFSEASGHVDPVVVNQTLPGALTWLWKGYKAR